MSSEFAEFVRDTGVRAFDILSERAKEVAKPLRPILRAWMKLANSEKNELLDELIGSVQASPLTSSPLEKRARKKSSKKPATQKGGKS